MLCKRHFCANLAGSDVEMRELKLELQQLRGRTVQEVNSIFLLTFLM